MTKEWTYKKDGGENYPVQPGQVWAVGPHLFACTDLTDHTSNRFWQMLAAPPALMYCDPPWNTGNVRSFYTKAKRQHGPDIHDVLGAVMGVAARFKLNAYLEAGVAQVQPIVLPTIARTGGTVAGSWPITYYRKAPAALIHATWSGVPFPSPPDLTGRDDEDTPGIVLWHALASGILRPGDVVIDPCTGRGLIPSTAAALGLHAAGTELSQWRLSVTLTKLAAITGITPRLVGGL